MTFIYFLFSLLKNVVPFEDEESRISLQQEMSQKFDELQDKGGFLSTLHTVLNSVWARFLFVIAYVPLQRKLQNFVFPQTNPVGEDYEDLEDYEEGEQDA